MEVVAVRFDDRVDGPCRIVDRGFLDERAGAVDEAARAVCRDGPAGAACTANDVASFGSSNAEAALHREHPFIILSYLDILSSRCLICAADILIKSNEVFYRKFRNKETIVTAKQK